MQVQLDHYYDPGYKKVSCCQDDHFHLNLGGQFRLAPNMYVAELRPSIDILALRYN